MMRDRSARSSFLSRHLFYVIAALFACGAFGVLSTIARHNGTAADDGRRPAQPARITSVGLGVVSHAIERQAGGRRAIAGHVSNYGDTEYELVELRFDLFDSDGDRVGTAMDQLEEVASGTARPFRAPLIEGDVAEYRLAALAGRPVAERAARR